MDAMIGEYNRGTSISVLCKKYGKCYNTIKRQLLESGIRIRDRLEAVSLIWKTSCQSTFD